MLPHNHPARFKSQLTYPITAVRNSLGNSGLLVISFSRSAEKRRAAKSRPPACLPPVSATAAVTAPAVIAAAAVVRRVAAAAAKAVAAEEDEDDDNDPGTAVEGITHTGFAPPFVYSP